MLLFDRVKDGVAYRDLNKHKSEANMRLRWLIEWLDMFSVFIGYGDITITAYVKDGFHENGTALDLRIRDKRDMLWYVAMILLLKAIEMLVPWLVVNPHFKEYLTQPHIHIRVKDMPRR